MPAPSQAATIRHKEFSSCSFRLFLFDFFFACCRLLSAAVAQACALHCSAARASNDNPRKGLMQARAFFCELNEFCFVGTWYYTDKSSR